MKPNWKPIKICLGDIICWEHNPRLSNKAQAKRLIESEKRWGQPMAFAVSPLKDGKVFLYDGHQRYSAWLTVYGADYEVDARQSDIFLTEEERLEFVVTMHAGATGSWDWQKLSSFPAPKLIEMGFDNEKLKDWNNNANNLKELLNSEKPEPLDAEPQIDRAAELQEKWATASGQLWKLGEHRLLIGDCMVRENVDRLMGGERARVCFTSPPYDDQRQYEIGEFDWLALMNGASNSIFYAIGSPSDVLINLGMSYKDGRVNFYWNKWLEYCENLGRTLYGMYVWDKGSGFPGEWNGRLAPSHELVFHFSDGRVSANKWIKTSGESEKRGTSGKRFRQKDGSMKELTSPDSIGQAFKVPDSVIRVGREMARGIHTQSHPAVYSVEFAEFGLNTWSKVGDVAFEPFCGSGTTIIAAHNLNRRCYAMEISEKYGAVILERFFTATGIQPELVTE